MSQDNDTEIQLALDWTGHTSSVVALLTELSCWVVCGQAKSVVAAAEVPEEAVKVATGGDALLVGSTGGVDADFTCTTAI